MLIVAHQVSILLRLAQDTVSNREKIDLRSHEAAEGVFRRADDRLAAHIEAGVDEHRAAGQRLEAADQRVIARIGLRVHGLDAGRIVDMGDGRECPSAAR